MALFDTAERVCCNCDNWQGMKEWVSQAKAWFSLNELPGQCFRYGTQQFPDDACPQWCCNTTDPNHTPYLGGTSKTSTTT